MEMVYHIRIQGEEHKQGHDAILTVMLEKIIFVYNEIHRLHVYTNTVSNQTCPSPGI